MVGSGLFDPAASFATDRGLLILSSAPPVTFRATVATGAVPGPSSLALCGVATLGGLMRWGRRRPA